MMIRQGWRVLVLAHVVALLVMGQTAILGVAQTADESESARFVNPAECTNDPLAVDALTRILGLDGDGKPMLPYVSIVAPLGEVVDTATAISIKEATRQLLACFNAGDIPRAAALMTERGVQRTYWGLTIDQATREATAARLAAVPRPREAKLSLRIIAVTDISRLPDGQVAAFVVINDPLLPPAGPETLLFLFANHDGAWLLDDWVDFSIASVAER